MRAISPEKAELVSRRPPRATSKQTNRDLSLSKEPTFLAWGKPIPYLVTLSFCSVSKVIPFKLAPILGRRSWVNVRRSRGEFLTFQGFLIQGQVTVVLVFWLRSF